MEIAAHWRASPPRLTTGNRLLDDFLEGFEPGRLTLLNSASPFVHDLVFHLCLRQVLDFDRDVVFVDGGNTMNPHPLAALAKREGVSRQAILGRVRVARAFTAYQMASLLLEALEEEVRAGPGLLVLSAVADLFLDEDVAYEEAYHLLRRGLHRARELVREEELVGIMTNHGLSQLFRRRGIGNVVHEMADRVVRIQVVKGGLLLVLPGEGRSLPFLPVPPDQAVLEDYGDVGPPLPLVLEPAPARSWRGRPRQAEISAFC